MVISEPSKKYLWILSKGKKLSSNELDIVINNIRTHHGFNNIVDELIFTK